MSDLVDECKLLAVGVPKKTQNFSELLLRAEVSGNTEALGWCAMGRAKYSRITGDIYLSLEWLDKAEMHFSQLSQTEGLAHTGMEKGKMLFMLGDISTGRAQLQASVEWARQIGKRQLEGLALGSLAFSYGEQGEAEPYAALTREALTIFEELGDRPMLASMQVNLGGALIKLLRLDEAEAYYLAAQEIAFDLKLRNIEALCLAGQGSIACRRGDIEAGLSGYEQSNRLLSELGNPFMIARHCFMAAKYAHRAGLLSRAEALLLQACELIEAHRFGSLAWQVYEELASLKETQDLPRESLYWLKRRITAREKMLDERTEEQLKILRFSHRMEIIKQEAALIAARSVRLEGNNRVLQDALEREQSLRRQVEVLATTDPLTGLLNRRSWEQRANEAYQRHARHQHEIVMALLDIDYFKRINDTYGHSIGDEVLQQFAQRMKLIFREMDAIGRYGGEEFCVLFEGYTMDQAYVACNRLLQNLREHAVDTEKGPLWVAASIGLAQATQLSTLIRNSDRALYRAKNLGRAQTVMDCEQLNASSDLVDATPSVPSILNTLVLPGCIQR